MSYVETRMIKGRKYLYEVSNYRDGKKVKHKRKYLGPVAPVRQRKRSTGRKPSCFVRALTSDEKIKFAKTKKSNNAFVRDRAKIIILSAEGKQVKDISERLQRDSLSVRKIIEQFNQEGLNVLIRKTSKGRPKTISAEEEKDLIESANKTPKDVGLPYANWTCSLLSKWFNEKYGKFLSPEWIRRILHKYRITFTMPKHKLLKADEKLKSSFKKS